MTKTNPRIELLRMMAEAGDARANFRTWRTLDMSKGDGKRLKAMNDSSHVDFFHVTIWGTQTLAFLSLGKIFDQSKRALRMHDLARDIGDNQLEKDLEDLHNTHGQVIEKIRSIRNKSVAHNQSGTSERSVFKQVGITPDEMERLIADVCRILNEAARRASCANLIPDDLRFRKAVHALLDKLGNSEQP